MTTTALPPESEAPSQPPDPAPPTTRRPRALVITLVAVPTVLILVVMLGVFGGLVRSGSIRTWSEVVDALFRLPDLLVANTPTGGDMGAHVLLPQILRDSLLPSGRIFGWSMDWYAGFPALYFYFPLPALATVLLDVFLPYGVAFKLTTIVGLVALPSATYFFIRWLGFARVVAAIGAVAGASFVFMESFSIFGANIKSTLAGEFAFSWAFALSILYLGLVARDTREARPFSPWPGIVLGLTTLAHIVPTMVVVLVSAPLLFRRDGARTVATSWALGFGITAFWALPLGLNILDGLTTNMGWSPVTNIVGDAIPGSPVPGELVPVLVLGLIGVVWTMARRDDVMVLAWMTFLPLVGYFVLPKLGITILYNARLLPYWYFGIFVFAGLAAGLAVVEIARRFPSRRLALHIGASIAGTVFLVATALSIHDVPSWVTWNYEGYEGKAVYDEYRNLLETVDRLPPGRVMWEVNSTQNDYGTPMALMILPYWMEDHPSMEGVFFESSLTTPFHFLNASEVSERPSNPVRGLEYRGLNFDRALRHLPVYNISYYISFTEGARIAAEEAGLERIAEAPPWTIFAIPESELIDVATIQPAVWDGGGDFLDPALEWYDDVDGLDHWLVAEGPVDWPRLDEVSAMRAVAIPYEGGGEVSNVVVEDDRIAFSTTAVGKPHLVKVSYFPNWTADGAEGPYRAAPSLMVVVPTQSEVTLSFGKTPAENIGMVVTVLTLLALGGFVLLRRGRRASPSGPADAQEGA